jgi:hypothetical protein
LPPRRHPYLHIPPRAPPPAALRALVVDPRSRVPERKVLYAPWQQ